MSEHVETIIVGGGQSGLALSYLLTQTGREHLVLERGRLVERWRSERWDSLTLLSPNWGTRLPGWHYDGPDPDGFMARDEVVRFFEDYASSFDAPVRTGVTVTSVRQADGSGGYEVESDHGTFQAGKVVLATGMFQRPQLPLLAQQLPTDLMQVHSSRYRNPAQLPPGAVLVVGSGASGFQIAEELVVQGRRVFFSLGRQNLLPRRYRSKDALYWGGAVGFFNQRIEDIPMPPGSKPPPSPALTGVGGGHDLDARRLAADGAVLLGRLEAVTDGVLAIAPDLPESLASGDAALADVKKRIDEYIESSGLTFPEEPQRESLPKPPEELRPIERLDLRAEGVSSVVWATGFGVDFSWVKAPGFEGGRPMHRRGVCSTPGLYVLCVPPLYKIKSAFIIGIEEEVDYLAEQMMAS